MSAAATSLPQPKREAGPPTPDLQRCLLGLYMLADFRRVAARGRPPSPDFFARHGTLTGIVSTPRRTVLRLARERECLACDATLAADSTGDHVLALANGGPAGAENFIPLCGRCNSSKGRKDLFDWWLVKGRAAVDLPADALIVYVRVSFMHYGRLDQLCNEASAGLLAAVRELVALLPTEAHKRALGARVTGLAGRR